MEASGACKIQAADNSKVKTGREGGQVGLRYAYSASGQMPQAVDMADRNAHVILRHRLNPE
jgi:hypothetical protein